MKKLFISQPMRGKSNEEIMLERHRLVEGAKKIVNDDIEVLNSFFKDFDGNALAFLGKSIGVLSDADIAAFGRGWQNARGCNIEHMCCLEYGIATVEL
jgi:hypothetical protein